MRKSLVILSAIFISTNIFAQQAPCPPTQNKKAAGYLKDAQSLYQKREYEKARDIIQKAIDEDPEYAEAYLLSGFLAQKKKDYSSMGQMLRKAIELCEGIDPEAYYQLGWL